MKPVEGYHEVLKAEKEANGESKSVSDGKVFDSDFKQEAANYLASGNVDRKESYFPGEETVEISGKNSANLANIVSAAQPNAKVGTKNKHNPRQRAKPKSDPRRPMKSGKKKTQKTIKKMSSFKIIAKKK